MSPVPLTTPGSTPSLRFAGVTARRDRGECDRMHVRRDGTVGGQRRGERVDRTRTIRIVANVVFARPHRLDRNAGRFRDLDRIGDVVDREPPAEAAAQQRRVDGNGVDRQSRDFRGDRLRRRRDLRRRPNRHAFGAHFGGRVHRFHRRVREIWHVVGRAHDVAARQRSARIAGLFDDGAGLLHQFAHRREHRGRRRVRVGTVPERGVQHAPALERRPRVVGDDRNARRNGEHRADAGHAERGRAIERRDRAADLGRFLDRCELHPRNAEIESEDGGSVRFRPHVEAPRPRSE